MSGPYEPHGHAALKDGKITGYWRPMVYHGPDPMAYVMRLWSMSQDIYYMDFLMDGLSPISRFLSARGHKATPYYTQVIDLTLPTEKLRRGLRKSYKSLVNKDIMVNTMFDTGAYQSLHESIRGVTRPQETWDIQNRMIWQRQAFCLTQTHFLHPHNPLPSNVVTDAGLIVYYNKDAAYYASGCSTVDSHALMWEAILKAKRIGCKRFEMGEQVYGDDKLANISKFKRGFGGRTEVRLILRKEE